MRLSEYHKETMGAVAKAAQEGLVPAPRMVLASRLPLKGEATPEPVRVNVPFLQSGFQFSRTCT